MPEKMEEIEVEKHFKMKSPFGVIEGHSSGSIIGVWARAGKEQIGIVVDDRTKRPYVTFCKNATSVPACVMTTEGLQIMTNTGPKTFSWQEIAKKLD